MATPQGPNAPSSVADESDAAPEWTQQVTDLVTDSVDKVRSRTTGPLMGAAHGMVYAVVAAVVAVPVVVVLFVGFIRLFNWAVPGDVWIIYAILAAVLWIAGLVCWARRGGTETPT